MVDEDQKIKKRLTNQNEPPTKLIKTESRDFNDKNHSMTTDNGASIIMIVLL